MSFVERDPWDNCDHEWHDPNDLPEATRDAILTVWEMPKHERIDSFPVKGRRVNLSLDKGRYCLVHNHPQNGWERYISVECNAEEYREVCRMLRQGRIDGMTSAVTSEGTRHMCTVLNCRFVSLSQVEMVRHIRKHNPQMAGEFASAVNIVPPSDANVRNLKRSVIKDQLRNLSPEIEE